MKRILLLFLIIWANGCYYDNEETLYPDLNTNCDLTNVTFTGSVKPILADNCLMCHSTASASASGGGVKLENFSDVSVYVSNNKLYGSISQSSGFAAMPKGGNKLGSCALQTIKKWIDNGALNN